MADDEQFSLCWNNFNTNLSAGFHESLCRGDLVDVTLAAEGQLVKAHRLVLSVCSPYFRKMFTQMPANQHAFVFLKDVSHSALKDLIQFMYCGEVNVKQDALPAFISTAEALQIKGLTENGDGPSAPAPHPSPAKESTIVHSTPAAPHPVASSRVGQKIVQRGRVQSYKVESEESSDEKAQTVHVQPTPVAQKRTIARTITPSSTPVMKRAKITTTADPLEASEPTVQTIQIVKNVPSSEPEYVEMPIETINPKSEPEYVEDTAVIEGTDQEHDDTETHEIHETEEGQYVEDESYGDMKYDESYFTEGDDTKAGASGFGESYAEGADQSASEAQEAYYDELAKTAHFTLSAKKGTVLVVGGYTFIKKSTFNNVVYYNCSQQKIFKCPGRLHVANNKIVIKNANHNHQPVTVRRARGELKEFLKVKAEDYPDDFGVKKSKKTKVKSINDPIFFTPKLLKVESDVNPKLDVTKPRR